MTDTPIFQATVRAWVADEIDRLFADLRERWGLGNTLAYDGPYCAACGTFLRAGNHGGEQACPMGCGGQP